MNYQNTTLAWIPTSSRKSRQPLQCTSCTLDHHRNSSCSQPSRRPTHGCRSRTRSSRPPSVPVWPPALPVWLSRVLVWCICSFCGCWPAALTLHQRTNREAWTRLHFSDHHIQCIQWAVMREHFSVKHTLRIPNTKLNKPAGAHQDIFQRKGGSCKSREGKPVGEQLEWEVSSPPTADLASGASACN